MPRPVVNEPRIVPWLRAQDVKLGASQSEFGIQVRDQRDLAVLEARCDLGDDHVPALKEGIALPPIGERPGCPPKPTLHPLPQMPSGRARRAPSSDVPLVSVLGLTNAKSESFAGSGIPEFLQVAVEPRRRLSPPPFDLSSG